MKNFYYVQSYNMANPGVRAMLSVLGVIEMHDSMSDFQIRSKYFLSFSEAIKHAQADFRKKLPMIYPPSENPKDTKENALKIISVMNPKFSTVRLDPNETYNEQIWDENCCGTMFCCEMPSEEAAEEDFPNHWMVKYEIFFEEDIIEFVSKNGEHAFEPSVLAFQNFSSAVH